MSCFAGTCRFVLISVSPSLLTAFSMAEKAGSFADFEAGLTKEGTREEDTPTGTNPSTVCETNIVSNSKVVDIVEISALKFRLDLLLKLLILLNVVVWINFVVSFQCVRCPSFLCVTIYCSEFKRQYNVQRVVFRPQSTQVCVQRERNVVDVGILCYEKRKRRTRRTQSQLTFCQHNYYVKTANFHECSLRS